MAVKLSRLRTSLAEGPDKLVLGHLDDALRAIRRAQEACHVPERDLMLQRRADTLRREMGRVAGLIESLGTILPKGFDATELNNPDGPGPTMTKAWQHRQAVREERIKARKARRTAASVFKETVTLNGE